MRTASHRSTTSWLSAVGVLLLDVLLRALQVLPLELHRGRACGRRRAGRPRVHVRSRDTSCSDGTGFASVRSGRYSSSIIFRISDGGPDLQEGRDLAQVGVADDHVQPPVLLGVGVRLVARVDDRALERGLQADLGLEEVRALRELVAIARFRSSHAASAPSLPAPQKIWRRTKNGVRSRTRLANGTCAVDEVVLVRPVRVPLAVAVVLVDGDPLGRPASCAATSLERPLEHALARLVVDHEVARGRALGRRVLGMRVVDVVPGAVRQDHVREAEVLLRRLADLDRLEPARVAERRLLLVVPPDPAERARVRADQQRRRDDRVELGRRRRPRSRTRSRCR